MEPKKIILSNLKKEQSTRDHSAWYQTALQGHCYYKSLILASEKTCWSMEQNREPRNKPKSLWSKFKIIANMEATSKNIRNYILKNDSNVRGRERHSHTIISLCICSSNEDFEPLVFLMENVEYVEYCSWEHIKLPLFSHCSTVRDRPGTEYIEEGGTIK